MSADRETEPIKEACRHGHMLASEYEYSGVPTFGKMVGSRVLIVQLFFQWVGLVGSPLFILCCSYLFFAAIWWPFDGVDTRITFRACVRCLHTRKRRNLRSTKFVGRLYGFETRAEHTHGGHAIGWGHVGHMLHNARLNSLKKE